MSDADRERAEALAALDAAFSAVGAVGWSNQLAGALAASPNDPWLGLAASMASAEASRATTATASRSTHANALSAALEDYEDDLAGASQAYANSRATAAQGYTNNVAGAQQTFTDTTGTGGARVNGSNGFAAMVPQDGGGGKKTGTSSCEPCVNRPYQQGAQWDEQTIRHAISIAHPAFGKIFNYHAQLLMVDPDATSARYEYENGGKDKRSMRIYIPPNWTNAQVVGYVFGKDQWGWDLHESVIWSAENYGQYTNPWGIDKDALPIEIEFKQDQLRRLREAGVVIEGLLTDTVRSVPGGEIAYGLYMAVDGKLLQYVEGEWRSVVETTAAVTAAVAKNPGKSGGVAAAVAVIVVVGADGKVLKVIDDVEVPKGVADAPSGPVKRWTQSAADSHVLARNLGILPGSGLDAHHIVAGEHRRAAAARRLLERYQIDLNDAANGVPVVGGTGAPKTVLPRHHRGGGLHSYRGLDEVNDRLSQVIEGVDDWATGRQRILGELAKIREEILNGTFPN